jgi:hypothetical protein
VERNEQVLAGNSSKYKLSDLETLGVEVDLSSNIFGTF